MIRRSMFWWLIAAIIVLMAVAAYLFAPAAADAARAWWVSSPELADQWPNRGIDNAGELWKNGYLGLFFRHELFGALPFLGVPAWFAFLFTIRKRPRWQLALFCSGTLTAALIAIRGFYNWRYAFTLQPLLVAFILFMAWTLSSRRLVRAALLGVVCILVIHSYRCQCGRYNWFVKSLASRQDDGLPWALVKHLNAEAGEGRRGVLSMNCSWPRYYTEADVIDLTHHSVSRLLGTPDEEALKSIFYNHGVCYVVSSDLNEAWLEKTSLKPFIDLLRSRALRISDRGNYLYCVEPGITSWSDVCGVVAEICFPAITSSTPVDCESLVGDGGRAYGWRNVGWRGEMTVQAPEDEPGVIRLVAVKRGPDIGESNRHTLLLQPGALGTEGIPIPLGAKIAEFECELRSGTPDRAGSMLLRLDARSRSGWFYNAATRLVNSPAERWERCRAILYLNEEFESVNPILEWCPGAEGDVLDIRSPRLLLIPFPAISPRLSAVRRVS